MKTWVLTPEVVETIRQCAFKGWKEDSMAKAVGLHPSTFSEKKNLKDADGNLVHPEIAEAIRVGRLEGVELAESIVVEIMTNPGSRNRLEAVKMYLKEFGQWDSLKAPRYLPPQNSKPTGFDFQGDVAEEVPNEDPN